MSTPIAKPQLRGLLTSQIKKNLVVMMVVSISAGVAYKIFVVDKRKRKYAEFYKTYDAEKQLKIMNEAGLMQSYNIEQK
ncbi:Cytochrome c oxidase subunit 6C [Trachymyrmex zeteki]|uniref:Cytochrome c oxidase subunit 6C n=1 Tax=Mycetomoellerius zeteki TaxID=64791 RepID=A0A151WPY7_9HYME|nr:PREDICTED: cytochrome c oxidase subunit 6C [Trachymyrmex zeteki]XP_018311440.1 PREDICTED: cytochrome c oxidase subunit 6C [Trachymyrmex zeteki]KYQ49863.1 Cytochrome c oxidase subunit 6C [Trachymyrmex zeteki]